MKIVQDFGFEVTKNATQLPNPPENEKLWKIVQDFGFEVTKNTPSTYGLRSMYRELVCGD